MGISSESQLPQVYLDSAEKEKLTAKLIHFSPKPFMPHYVYFTFILRFCKSLQSGQQCC